MRAILSLSHFWIYMFFIFFNLFPFFGPTKQYVQRWKKVDTWNRCCEFTPLDPTKQYVHCMRKVTTWCHFEKFPPFEPSKPYGWFNIWRKLTCWVNAIDLSSGPLQNTLFDIWTDLAFWVMFEMSLPSPTTKQDVERTKLEPRVMFGIYAHWTIHSNTFNIWIKLTCWFILLDLPALSPTKRYV